jgi:phosphate transport system protein
MSRADLDRQLTALRVDISSLEMFVDDLLQRALASVSDGDAYHARIALNREEEFDRTYSAIEERTIDLLTLQQPVLAADLRLLVGGLVVAQRLQRVGHGAFGVARLAIDLAGFATKETTLPALLELGQEARQMLHDAVTAFVQNNVAVAQQVITRDQTADTHYRALRDDLLRSLSQVGTHLETDEFTHRRLTYWLWIGHKLERVADHAVVIAKRVQQLQ